jgi:homogentisate 1,2-dioxygenase
MVPLSKGRVTRQAHVGLPEGTFEEEHGREAFDGRAAPWARGLGLID